jgi:hypothetical protein
MLHALRSLAHQKSLFTAALVTLALGIGANTPSSPLSSVLLRPLPFPESDRLVQLTGRRAWRDARTPGRDVDQ